MALVWGGYTIGLYGYCLVQGYDIRFTDLFHVTWPGGQAPVTTPSSGAQKNPVVTPPATGTTQAPGTSTAGGRG